MDDSGFEVMGANLTAERRKRIQKLVINRMKRRNMITAEQAEELEAKGWQDFLDWLLENGPAILEFIMSLIAMFGGI